MAEQLDLTNPITYCQVTELHMNFLGANSHIYIRVEGKPTGGAQAGKAGSFYLHNYYGTEAETLLKVLNTANLSVKSLHKRILEKLIADGVILGTVSGTPDP